MVAVPMLAALLANGNSPVLCAETATLRGQSDEHRMWPKPIATAVMFLGWSRDKVPRIVVVKTRPPDVSPTAEAWIRCDGDGTAQPVIYVAADSYTYLDALQEDRQALVKLAGILAHEQWHIRHGLDEVGAYEAQLVVMAHLQATEIQLTGVRLALREVRRRQRRRDADIARRGVD
jgi:hypothetical protein